MTDMEKNIEDSKKLKVAYYEGMITALTAASDEARKTSCTHYAINLDDDASLWREVSEWLMDQVNVVKANLEKCKR